VAKKSTAKRKKNAPIGKYATLSYVYIVVGLITLGILLFAANYAIIYQLGF
jgi:hypothetical protein